MAPGIPPSLHEQTTPSPLIHVPVGTGSVRPSFPSGGIISPASPLIHVPVGTGSVRPSFPSGGIISPASGLTKEPAESIFGLNRDPATTAAAAPRPP